MSCRNAAGVVTALGNPLNNSARRAPPTRRTLAFWPRYFKARAPIRRPNSAAQLHNIATGSGNGDFSSTTKGEEAPEQETEHETASANHTQGSSPGTVRAMPPAKRPAPFQTATSLRAPWVQETEQEDQQKKLRARDDAVEWQYSEPPGGWFVEDDFDTSSVANEKADVEQLNPKGQNLRLDADHRKKQDRGHFIKQYHVYEGFPRKREAHPIKVLVTQLAKAVNLPHKQQDGSSPNARSKALAPSVKPHIQLRWAQSLAWDLPRLNEAAYNIWKTQMCAQTESYSVRIWPVGSRLNNHDFERACEVLSSHYDGFRRLSAKDEGYKKQQLTLASEFRCIADPRAREWMTAFLEPEQPDLDGSLPKDRHQATAHTELTPRAKLQSLWSSVDTRLQVVMRNHLLLYVLQFHPQRAVDFYETFFPRGSDPSPMGPHLKSFLQPLLLYFASLQQHTSTEPFRQVFDFVMSHLDSMALKKRKRNTIFKLFSACVQACADESMNDQLFGARVLRRRFAQSPPQITSSAINKVGVRTAPDEHTGSNMMAEAAAAAEDNVLKETTGNENCIKVLKRIRAVAKPHHQAFQYFSRSRALLAVSRSRFLLRVFRSQALRRFSRPRALLISSYPLALCARFDDAVRAVRRATQLGISRADETLFRHCCGNILKWAMTESNGCKRASSIVSDMLGMGIQYDTIMMNVLILNAVENLDESKALRIYHSGIRSGLQPNPYTFDYVLRALRNFDGVEPELRDRILDEAVEFAIERMSHRVANAALRCTVVRATKEEVPGIDVWESVCHGYARLFHAGGMEQLGILRKDSWFVDDEDDSYTLASLSPSYKNIDNEASWHGRYYPSHPVVKKHLLQPDQATVSIMTQAWLLCNPNPHLGRVKELLSQFLQLVEWSGSGGIDGSDGIQRAASEQRPPEFDADLWRTVAANQHIWNIFIMAAGRSETSLSHRSAAVDFALAIFRRMVQGSENLPLPRPDIYTFNLLLYACKRHSAFAEFEAIDQVMQERGISRNECTWDAIVGHYSTLQDIERVTGALDQMQKEGFKTDKVLSKALRKLGAPGRRMLKTELATRRGRASLRIDRGTRQRISPEADTTFAQPLLSPAARERSLNPSAAGEGPQHLTRTTEAPALTARSSPIHARQASGSRAQNGRASGDVFSDAFRFRENVGGSGRSDDVSDDLRLELETQSGSRKR